MKNFQIASAVLVAVILAACGSKKPEQAAAGAADPAPKAAPSGNASAEDVAEEARGDVDCPADIKTPARAAGAPVDDVVGIRPGMTYEEAANVVLCTNDLIVVQPDNSRGFQVQSYGQTIRQGFNARFAEPRVEKSSKQIMQEMQDEAMARGSNAVRPDDMKPGQSKWYVGTMGLPGQEQVVNAAREEWFEEGRNPTIAGVEQAVITKYGTPTSNRDAGVSGKYLTWAYDTSARLITETSPLVTQCTGTADPDGGVNLSPDCGIVMSAVIFPMRDNPELSQYLQVSVVDQAGGYERISATEQALQQQENQRRAEQVQDAAKNADAPTL